MRMRVLFPFPFIEYIEPAPHGAQPLNYIAKQNSRGSVLNSATSVGGFNLKGNGVVVGVGDDSGDDSDNGGASALHGAG